MLELDHFDLALLEVLQRFGRATHQQLGEQIPLSPSQIGRRLQRLESAGVKAIGLPAGLVAEGVETQQQLDVLPEVLECHAVVGDADYLLRIVAPDLNALSSFVMKKLMRVPGVDRALARRANRFE